MENQARSVPILLGSAVEWLRDHASGESRVGRGHALTVLALLVAGVIVGVVLLWTTRPDNSAPPSDDKPSTPSA